MKDSQSAPAGQVLQFARPGNGHPPEDDFLPFNLVGPDDPPPPQPLPEIPYDFFDHEPPPESSLILPATPAPPPTPHDPKAPEDYSAFRERVSLLPPIHWHARDLFPSEGIVLFHGRPRSMKTLAMQECAYKLASGVAPFNSSRFEVHRPIRVAYLTEEDSEQLVNCRLALIEVGIKPLRPEPGHFIPLVRKGLSLDTPGDLILLRKKIEAAKVEILFLEPMRSLTALAEKTASEFKPTLDWMRTLQRETACKLFVMGHHWRKPNRNPSRKGKEQEDNSPYSERASGSALFSISDCLFAFEKLAWNKTLVIPGDFKLGNDPESFEVTWETKEGQDSTGKPVFSTYIRATAETKSGEQAKQEHYEAALLAWLASHPWATTDEAEEGAKVQKGCGALHSLFMAGKLQMVTKDAAKAIGRSSRAKLYALLDTSLPRTPPHSP